VVIGVTGSPGGDFLLVAVYVLVGALVVFVFLAAQWQHGDRR
jgi:hypothetical protein